VALGQLNLSFGIRFPIWQDGLTPDLASVFKNEISPYEETRVQFLEPELISLLNRLVSPRNRMMTLRYFG